MSWSDLRDTAIWREALATAYANDPHARQQMDRFNARRQELEAMGQDLSGDVLAIRLHAALVLAVRAYLDGKPIGIATDGLAMQ